MLPWLAALSSRKGRLNTALSVTIMLTEGGTLRAHAALSLCMWGGGKGGGGQKGGGGGIAERWVCLTNKAEAFASSFSVADLACQVSIILRQLLHEVSC